MSEEEKSIAEEVVAQEAELGHRLLSLGHDVFAEVSLFRGKVRLGLRKWYHDETRGEWRRSRNGLQLTVEEFQDVLLLADEVKTFAEAEASDPYEAKNSED